MIVRSITASQARDTGLAFVLILLLVGHFRHDDVWILPAIGVLVMTMIWPGFFRPFGYVWFTAANVLRKVVSSILLTVIFLVIATPIGWIRRIVGADPMQRRRWKKDQTSVFVQRDHIFSAEDLERPY